MKLFKTFWRSLLDRFLAGLLLVGCLPMLIFIAWLVLQTGGRPVIVTDELSGVEVGVLRRCRFRTTGRGAAGFLAFGRFLRVYSLDDLPGLWSVVRGDIGLSDYFRVW